MLSRDFKLVWFGQGVSGVGTAATTLVLPLLAILDLHATALQVGSLSAATYAAYAILALPMGAWLDRRARRPVVVVGDVGRLIAIGSVPVAHALGVLSFAQLVIVAVAVGTFDVAFDVAYQSWLPAIVGSPDLVKANATLGATESVGRLAGPGVAGLLVAWVGAAYTLSVDAASFAIAACATMAVATREFPVRATRPDAALRGEIREGLRWLWRAPVLRRVTACRATANFFIAVWTAVETVFLVHTVHAKPALIGVIVAVGGCGGVLGGVIARVAIERVGTQRALLLSIALAGVSGLVAPLGTLALGSWVVAVSLFGTSATLAIYNIGAVSLRQLITPADLLARATSANRVFSYGALPLGALSGGVLASVVGPRATLVVAAIGCAAAAGWLRRIV